MALALRTDHYIEADHILAIIAYLPTRRLERCIDEMIMELDRRSGDCDLEIEQDVSVDDLGEVDDAA
jgi:hypothetical protein